MEQHKLGEGHEKHTPFRNRRRSRKRLWFFLSLAILTPLALGLVAAGALVYRLSRDLPDVRTLARYRPSQTTEIYSSDGLLLARLFDENREVVPLAQIPPDMLQATIAIEDHRYYEHKGVDWRGSARALVANIRSRGYVQGGSTITQQLVRNVFLSPEKSLNRKIRESILATRVERRFSKPEILGMYLNQVYYGQRSFGVEAASRRYFGKSVKDLRLAEAALLAGIPQRPTTFDPYQNLKAAQQRRNRVLKRMAEVGFITEKRARAAMNQPVRLAYQQPPRLTVRQAHYFVDYVIQDLEDRYGAEKLYRGGLKVQTTLNTRAQEAAERALRANMDARFGRRSRTQAALVSIDPTNGYVRAMVGGRDWRRSMFNRAVQAKRQPGSAFKPFVYAAAMGAGYSPADRITDAPIKFEHTDWKPKNYDGRWHGQVTLTEALAQSINIPAIKLLAMVGPENVIRLARSAGIQSPLHEELSLALGTSELSPLELASAYTIFASGGIYTPPIAILRVRDANGHILESHYPDPVTVLDETVARRMDFMLRQVVRIGTGRPAQAIPNARGKTGTTNDLKDAWFVGYTPSLVTAVWVGNDIPSRIPGLTGGGACAPIWVSFMRRAARILPQHPLPESLRMPVAPKERIYVAEASSPYTVAEPGSKAGVMGITDVTEGASEPVEATAYEDTPLDEGYGGYGESVEDAESTLGADVVQRRVCLVTGQLATSQCTQTELTSFAKGSAPVDRCTLHRRSAMEPSSRSKGRGDVALLCRTSGDLAGPQCHDLVTVMLHGEKRPGPCRQHGRRLGDGAGGAGGAVGGVGTASAVGSAAVTSFVR